MKKLSKKKRHEFLDAIYDLLFSQYGKLSCSLDHSNPLELMVATILSAQCTDARVNKITPALFKKYPTAHDYAIANQEELEDDIRSAGFFRNKAKSIIGACQVIDQSYGGELPNNLTDLVKLPGIGRKTANVILGDAFDVPGFPVDTHVTRLLNLIGLVKTDNAVKIEQFVIEVVDEARWVNFSHLLINHGRLVCVARKPKCEQCVLNKKCELNLKNNC
ncbi:endonuclease III [Lentisphaerota bacterium WC36G]|nr:endonuclease III [Lentisphaerae bacterium WC36]